MFVVMRMLSFAVKSLKGKHELLVPLVEGLAHLSCIRPGAAIVFRANSVMGDALKVLTDSILANLSSGQRGGSVSARDRLKQALCHCKCGTKASNVVI